MKLAIIGGGAAGLMLASILRYNNVDIDIVILEKLDHVGKKILMSGNGKCNLSNANITCNSYNNELGFKVASSFNVEQYFNDLGLLHNNLIHMLSAGNKVFLICVFVRK